MEKGGSPSRKRFFVESKSGLLKASTKNVPGNVTALALRALHVLPGGKRKAKAPQMRFRDRRRLLVEQTC
jgi:hypothetical protein